MMNQSPNIPNLIEEWEKQRAENAAEKAKKYEARAVKSAQRKAKLAAKLDDDATLWACLRFYLKELNHTYNLEEILEKHRNTTRKMRHNLTAARRILDVWADKQARSFRLPKSWRARVQRRLGVDLSRRSEAGITLKILRSDLVVDSGIQRFAKQYPILEPAKRFLLEGLEKHPVPPTPPTPYELLLSQRLARFRDRC
jgi:hypothetical protein